MPARNLMVERSYQNIGGANTTAAISNLAPFEASDLNNVNLTLTGALEKRFGYRPVNGVAWGTRKIRLVKQFIQDGGVNQIVVFGTQSGSTSGWFAALSGTPYLTGTSFSNLLTVSTTNRPSMVQFESQLFLFNGEDDKVYNGTATARIGIEAPATACSGTSPTGGYLSSGTYGVAYSYRNTTTYAESNLSPLVFIDADTDDKLSLTDIVAGDANKADKIRLYRTVANGSQLFYEKDIDISSTSAELGEVASGGDGVIIVNVLAEYDNDLPPSSRIAHKIENRIFIRDEDNKNTVRFSKISPQYGAMPESYPVENFIECDPDDGDLVVGISEANGMPIIFKERSVGKAVQTGNDVYVYRKIADIECLGHHAITVVGQNSVWLSRSNIHMTDGVNVQNIGNQIETTIKDFNFNRPSTFSAINILDTQQIRFSVCNDLVGTDGEPDMVIVGDYKQGDRYAWTFYRPVGTAYPAIQAASFGSTVNSVNKVEYLFGNSKGNGYLYQMDYGFSDIEDLDNIYPIYFEVISRWYDFGNDANKLWKYVNTKFNFPAGGQFLFVGAQYNFSDVTNSIKNIEVGADQPKWTDEVTYFDKWGDNLWAVTSLRDENCYLHKKAKQARLIFRNAEIGAPCQLLGWSIYGGACEFR